MQLSQNLSRIVSEEATGQLAPGAMASGPHSTAPGTADGMWLPPFDRAAPPEQYPPGLRFRPFLPTAELRLRELQHVHDQSGLPYSWKDGLPVIPYITSKRQLALGIKRAADVVMALLFIFVFAPVFIITALAIKLSSKGPVLFKQRRVGLGNNEFHVYKFRTMYVEGQDLSGVRQTMADDARITTVGRLLRRTSVDEVPQIINILKGEMSFVGPRPHVAGMLAGGLPYEELVPYYDLRHAMKPGLTGWAQANGLRGPTIDPIRARQRVDHDIAYIQNFSLWLDLVVIARTAWREFITGTGV
ncbi:MAG: sugar transferase [Devosia sp.]|nr:sugar transferase [Devosia sp.]